MSDWKYLLYLPGRKMLQPYILTTPSGDIGWPVLFSILCQVSKRTIQYGRHREERHCHHNREGRDSNWLHRGGSWRRCSFPSTEWLLSRAHPRAPSQQGAKQKTNAQGVDLILMPLLAGTFVRPKESRFDPEPRLNWKKLESWVLIARWLIFNWYCQSKHYLFVYHIGYDIKYLAIPLYDKWN